MAPINDSTPLKDALDLIEQSIQRIPVHRKNFENQLGHRVFSGETDEEEPIYRFSGDLSKSSPRALVQKWIEKSSRKQKRAVKFLSVAKQKENPRLLLDQYVKRIKGNDVTPQQEEVMGCNLLVERPPSTSLAFYPRPNGILFEGEISSDPHKVALLQGAARLYYQLWYFRTVQAKDVTRAYGFVITSNARLSVSLLILEKPSSGPIGAPYNLYEYNLQSSIHQESARLWDDLGHFLLAPNLHAIPSPIVSPEVAILSCPLASPGYMLLPSSLLQELSENSTGWKVIPTITGSLVIRCETAEHVLQLLRLEEETDDRITAYASTFQNMVEQSQDDCVWYVKYKTPPFGPFWDTARNAINATRALLARKPHPQHAVVQEWLQIHPIDSLITPNRSITITRSVGNQPLSSLRPWKDFQHEFAALMKRTLDFQATTRLIQGDINEGNVLYNPQAAVGSRLHLIDWDEALRHHPCPRKTSNWEERTRYPAPLVRFPEHYTKQQFLHLFQALTRKYYINEPSGGAAGDKRDESKLAVILVRNSPPEQHHHMIGSQEEANGSFLSRTAVDARFKMLIRLLVS